ncbi:MAG TPA: lipase [Solirubrobacterales bacterium]
MPPGCAEWEWPEEDCEYWESPEEAGSEWESEEGEEEWPTEEGSPEEEEEAGHDPILFVRGIFANKNSFKTMIGRFKADGWAASRLHDWAYNWAQSNVTTAGRVSEKVNELLKVTGATKVDIVTHSMGGLSSRYFLKNIAGAQEKVDEWVSLGGPNHGTNWAFACVLTSCIQMRPNSTFLNELNAGDETPGEVNYGTWRSPGDAVVSVTSVPLAGALINELTANMSHGALHEDKTVYEEVREFVKF